MNSYLIFTDLDGTLLDHQDYRFTEALAALEKIRQARIPVIINSSKTQAEIADIRKQLHNNSAFVVENGAAVCVPAGLFPGYDQAVNQVILGRALTEILPIIQRLRETHGFSFQGFNDFSVADVMRETGLNEIQAEQAKQRLASEPLKWRDSQERLRQFQSLLRQQGLQLIKGGRFWHVMGGNDKSRAMAWLLNKYQQQQQRKKLLTIALGDSQNDLRMLEQADYAGVIRKPDGGHLSINKAPDRVIYSQHRAPLGWREVIDQLFSQLNIGEGNE